MVHGKLVTTATFMNHTNNFFKRGKKRHQTCFTRSDGNRDE